jgi:hypothetical protein
MRSLGTGLNLTSAIATGGELSRTPPTTIMKLSPSIFWTVTRAGVSGRITAFALYTDPLVNNPDIFIAKRFTDYTAEDFKWFVSTNR